MVHKFDEATISVMENGLYRFYESFAEFFGQIKTNSSDQDLDDVHSQAFNMEQMKVLIIMCIANLSIALIALASEITVYHFNKWRKRQ